MPERHADREWPADLTGLLRSLDEKEGFRVSGLLAAIQALVDNLVHEAEEKGGIETVHTGLLQVLDEADDALSDLREGVQRALWMVEPNPRQDPA